MAEGRVRQAAQVDHVGAGPPVGFGPRDDFFEAQGRGLDDLGEDAHVVARQVGRPALAAEELRQVGEIVGAALEGYAEVAPQLVQVAAEAPRQDHPVGREGPVEAAAQQVVGHEGGDLDPEVAHLVLEVHGRHGPEHLLEALARQGAGQEEEPFRHASRSPIARSRASRLSTTVVASKLLSRSAFSKSMRRG